MAVTVNAIMKKSAPAPAKRSRETCVLLNIFCCLSRDDADDVFVLFAGHQEDGPGEEADAGEEAEGGQEDGPGEEVGDGQEDGQESPRRTKRPCPRSWQSGTVHVQSLVFRRRDSSPKSLDLDLPFGEREHHHHHHHLSFFFDDDDKNAKNSNDARRSFLIHDFDDDDEKSARRTRTRGREIHTHP